MRNSALECSLILNKFVFCIKDNFLGNISLAGDELSAYSYNGTDTTGDAQYYVSLVDGNCQAVVSAVLNYHGDTKPMLEHLDAELQLNLSYEPLSTTSVFHKPAACSSLVPLETKPRFLEAVSFQLTDI